MDLSTGSTLGVLISNLGSPHKPTPEAVRVYLREFLSDPAVVDYPRWLWLPILHGIILRSRPRRSAELYHQIWTPQGSPLIYITEQIASRLEQELDTHLTVNTAVTAGMRYGRPAIKTALQQLHQSRAARLILLPLYPQYSCTTTGTTIGRFFEVQNELGSEQPFSIIDDYHDHPRYIAALAKTIQEDWDQHGKPERILFSFHGIPERFVRRGDPYQEQCQRTAELTASHLKLEKSEWTLAYQSQFGPEQWLEPAAADLLQEWGKENCPAVQVIAPGFAADCLETLEEIDHEGRRIFKEAGGGDFRYVPALNDRKIHIQMLAEIIQDHLADSSESKN